MFVGAEAYKVCWILALRITQQQSHTKYEILRSDKLQNTRRENIETEECEYIHYFRKPAIRDNISILKSYIMFTFF